MASGGGGGNAAQLYLEVLLLKDIGTIKSEIESGLSGIKPIELDFKVNQKSLDGIKQTLKDIQDLNKSGQSSTADRSVQAFKESTRAVRDYYESQKQVTAELERQAAAAQRASKASGGGSKNIEKGSLAQLRALKQVNDEYSKVVGYMERYTAAMGGSSSSSYSSFSNSLSQLKELETSLKSGTMSASDYQKALANIKLNISSANKEIKVAGENVKAQATSYTILTKGTTEQANALKKVSAEYDKVTKYLTKYSAAKSGKAAEPYLNLETSHQALQQLMNDLNQGGISVEDFKNRFASIQADVTNADHAIKTMGEDTMTLGERLSTMGQNFGRAFTDRLAMMFSAQRVISKGIETAKQMISTSIEIESAMSQIQVVTGSTDIEMERFFTSSTELAKELGQSIADVSKSIETFSRLGFKLGDASELAKYATILSNVADTDVGSATTGITSIIKGYGMDVSDVEHVADVLTKVGQEYAISAEELMEAFERGGAALNATGTSFEKSAALFAAANASLQNASTVGTLFRMISARIRGAKTELESMGEDTSDLADGFSKYREELIALTGVDIQDGEKKYRDLYDIFVDLAKVWDSLESDMARSRVAEILIAGKT